MYQLSIFAIIVFIFFPLQIYWLKDRVEVQPERDSNYIQAADGHLIIIQAREKDRANYTCVAENVANRRLSPPARLNVHGMLRFFFHIHSTRVSSVVTVSRHWKLQPRH